MTAAVATSLILLGIALLVGFGSQTEQFNRVDWVGLALALLGCGVLILHPLL